MPRKHNVSFGPVVVQKDGSPDLVAKCYSGSLDCTFRIGDTCTHVSPPRKIETLPETPDWCEMKAGMLRDAAKMAAQSDPA